MHVLFILRCIVLGQAALREVRDEMTLTPENLKLLASESSSVTFHLNKSYAAAVVLSAVLFGKYTYSNAEIAFVCKDLRKLLLYTE